MAQFQNHDLEFMVADYYDMSDFDDYRFEDTESPRDGADECSDSDFEDDFELTKPKTDTSALEARNGKDIQGIPWERLNFTRDKYRETRLRQYKNYENLSRSREEVEKECKDVEKGHNFYDFQFNTRLVKSTIVHFQISTLAKFRMPFIKITRSVFGRYNLELISFDAKLRMRKPCGEDITWLYYCLRFVTNVDGNHLVL